MYTPPWLFRDAPQQNNNQDMLQRMMMMQMQGRNDRRVRRDTMRDTMMMQAAASAMRQAFEGPQRNADRQLQRDMSAENRQLQMDVLKERLGPLSDRIGLMEAERRQADAVTDAQVQSTDMTRQMMENELQDRAKMERQNQASAGTNIMDQIGQGQIGNLSLEQETMQMRNAAADREIMDTVKNLGEAFDTYTPESGYGEIVSTEAAEARKEIFKSLGEINTALKSDDPAVVAAAVPYAEDIMARLKEGGDAGGWGNLNPFAWGAKSNIWDEKPVKEFRKLMDSSVVKSKQRKYYRENDALTLQMGATNNRTNALQLAILGEISNFSPKLQAIIDQELSTLRGAPPATGAQPPMPVTGSAPPGYQGAPAVDVQQQIHQDMMLQQMQQSSQGGR